MYDELKNYSSNEVPPSLNEFKGNEPPISQPTVEQLDTNNQINTNKFEERDYSKAVYYSQNPQERQAQLMERLKLKSKILQYQEKFERELIAYQYKMDKLDEFSNEDLVVFLDEIKIAVRQRNSLNMTKSLYFGGCDFVEKFGGKVGYDIRGFKNVLSSTQEIHKCLDEIALEFEDTMYMPATVRLGFITLQVAMSLYEVRNTERIINTELNKPLKQEIADLYNDL